MRNLVVVAGILLGFLTAQASVSEVFKLSGSDGFCQVRMLEMSNMSHHSYRLEFRISEPTNHTKPWVEMSIPLTPEQYQGLFESNRLYSTDELEVNPDNGKIRTVARKLTNAYSIYHTEVKGVNQGTIDNVWLFLAPDLSFRRISFIRVELGETDETGEPVQLVSCENFVSK